ncbi:MAG: type I glutamate--ammonia ligase [Geminicoccaceae bacterium]|nr:type I glutamate--ammonia ligase [Geminicoccaceae bacterium]MCB9945545.1 type I glutamate--ammonia ligase [Geminicoccaceae bacterium]
MSEAASVLTRLQEEGFRTLDLRFTDLSGRWCHTSIEAQSVTEEALARGILIDGASVPGWRDVADSDLLLHPDLATAWADPFSAQPTLVLYCDGLEPAAAMDYERDPRCTARRAERALKDLGFCDRLLASAEIGFFMFDDVRVEQGPMRSSYSLESSESRTAGSLPQLSGHTGHRPAPGTASLSLSPADHHGDIRAEITTILRSLGMAELRHEHGPAACMHKIAIGRGGLLETCDRLQLLKYVVHQVAASYGKSATFMAKPIAGEPGAPLSLALSLWQNDRPVFAGQGYADLSQTSLAFIAGILHHARALNAFTNPTANSYKRLQSGNDEPTLLAYAAHNRSAAVRIPYADQPARKRVECRFADPTANSYLALSAILLAGLDGVARKLEPGDAMDRNLYDLRPEELEGIPVACRSLSEALLALEQDQEFLTKNGVFTFELIEGYVEVKRQEIDRLARLPTPAELELYYGL